MDTVSYTKFILALVFVLGLIGLLTVIVRRFGLGMPQTPFKRAHEKRLGLVEVMPIDGKRRLVLLKRDDVEHLVILGATGETIVETNITHSVEQPDAKPATYPDAKPATYPVTPPDTQSDAHPANHPPPGTDFSRALEKASVLSQDDGEPQNKDVQI